MNEKQEDKSIVLSTDYQNHSINMAFSDNLTDDSERGYILSAAFFSYCAAEGMTKEEVSNMVSTYYDDFVDSNN